MRPGGNVLSILVTFGLALCGLLGAPRAAHAQTPTSSASAVFARVAPSVPVIETPDGHGTGFLIDPTHVMTDAHVIGNLDTVSVRFPDGATFTAKVVVRDRLIDMAVLEISTPRVVTTNVAPPPTEIGADLYVLGYPGRTSSSKQPIFSRGLLSQVLAWDDAPMTYLRTDASGEPGVSGGPILDASGNVVGVVQFRSSQGGYLIGAAAADMLSRAQRFMRGESVDGLASRPLTGTVGLTFDIDLRGGAEPEESFFVTPTSDVLARLTLDSTRFTGTVSMTVIEAGGDWIASGALSGTKRTVPVAAPLKAGKTYWINVSSDNPARLSLRSSTPIARFLDGDDVRTSGGRHVGMMDHPSDVDCRPVTLRAGQVITARAESVAFDPLLYVVSPGGVVMATEVENIDGIRGSNARVTTTTSSDGDFVVCVGEAVPSPVTGAYVLTVEASPAPPVASNTGGFTLSTARLALPRTNNATVALRDGRIMVIGGLDATGRRLDTAEVYDPATGAVSTVSARDVVARRDVTATLLKDGRVLVIGGVSEAGVSAVASVYDPTDGTWITVGSLGEARVGGEAILLDDGRVLVVTGFGKLAPLATAELFDPRTGQFAPTGSMASARSSLIASRLLDGRVLIAGGFDAESNILDTAEIYDPKSGRFRETGRLAQARYNHHSTTLPNGRVLITGGASKDGDLGDAELYDPATGAFSTTGSMRFPRQAHSAHLLPDGRVLIASGIYRLGPEREIVVEVGATEVYDPATGRFALAGGMRVPRQQSGASLPDGTTVFLGGTTEVAALDSIEVFRPGVAAAAGNGTFLAAPVFSTSGIALTIFGGGSVDQLVATARTAGAEGVWVQDGAGMLRLLIVNGPAFLGDVFRSAFAEGLRASTPVTLTR